MVIAREFAAALAEARGADDPPPDNRDRTAAVAAGTIMSESQPGLEPTVLAPD
ncbi:hypothetical protein [Streptomyces sp. NBC_00258]|uniref:hypothetical protein n=1 Tax=Streptomyces sp. NBC_00258 TaxID=2903642 RepID=UPI002E290E02|nr:hypothetical protein [Streptomyces sp. NBC_00258]